MGYNELNISDDKIIELYNSGQSSLKIAKLYHCNDLTIRNRLKKNNVILERKPIKYKINKNFFNSFNESSVYWLGFFCADGNIYKNEISIDLAYKDLVHLKMLQNMIGSNHPLQYRSTRNTIRLRFCNKSILTQLKKMGLTENKTFTLKFIDISDLYLPHFIRGYFDGDGSVHVDKRYNSLVLDFNGNFAFISKLNQIFSEKLNIKLQNMSPSKSIWRIRYTAKSDINEIFNYLYKDAKYYLARKKQVIENGRR